MHSCICEEPGRLVLAERPAATRQPGEVLLAIRRVGLCGTDYHIMRGTQPYLSYPRVMGHELSAEVIEADEDSTFAPGTLVAVLPYLFCGTCRACLRGRENCCRNLSVLGVHQDGGLTDRMSLHPRFLIDATGLTPDQAAMVEFLSIGHHAVGRAALLAGDRVLVVGAGPIGMAVTLFAAQQGAAVTVLDGNAVRARFCTERLGAAHAIVPGDEAALAEASAGDGFDAVFDCTGSPAAMTEGFARVGHGGSYVLVSVVSATITFDDPEFHKRETTLLGSRNATRADFAAVIAAIRAGLVPTEALHTHSTPMRELPARMTEWMDPSSGVIKAIVTP
ncbi:dehydrogenase [Croceibacterium mercuriale]|uniref:Dehydrogenase n=1 Tax=Croceibacterium mercuriale TaxID=1572751 RepID=A0A0B2BYN4_9SPHN|nr:zinc-binding alcohol dehydrogenase family protein [Croceibacterium mercuriale]KHL24771.1 dehydrogenase [Croceibacterium mercuriale]